MAAGQDRCGRAAPHVVLARIIHDRSTNTIARRRSANLSLFGSFQRAVAYQCSLIATTILKRASCCDYPQIRLLLPRSSSVYKIGKHSSRPDSTYPYRSFQLSQPEVMSTNSIAALPLQGKVAIVTGASRGIGAGLAIELARRGAYVGGH